MRRECISCQQCLLFSYYCKICLHSSWKLGGPGLIADLVVAGPPTIFMPGIHLIQIALLVCFMGFPALTSACPSTYTTWSPQVHPVTSYQFRQASILGRSSTYPTCHLSHNWLIKTTDDMSNVSQTFEYIVQEEESTEDAGALGGALLIFALSTCW